MVFTRHSVGFKFFTNNARFLNNASRFTMTAPTNRIPLKLTGAVHFFPPKNYTHLPRDARGAAEAETWRSALGNLSSQACRHKDIQVVLSPPRPLSWNRARPHLSLVSRLRSLSSTVGWKSHLAPPPSSKPGWVSSGEAGADWRLCLNPEACTEEAWVVRQHCFKTHFIQNSIYI